MVSDNKQPLATPSGGGTDTFPPEIWLLIFTHARNPIPTPLSRPPRSELRQQPLSALARCCQLFKSLVTPVLYQTVVTDDPAHFFSVGSHSTRQPLLSLIETLYIEYQDHELPYPYCSLLQHGGAWWDRVGPTEKQVYSLQMQRCQGEFIGIWFATMGLLESGLSTVLPRLRRIAIGSIYGHQGDLWSRYDKYDQHRSRQREGDADGGGQEPTLGPPLSMVGECRDAWEQILEVSSVTYLCVRDPSAPLGISTDRENLYHPKSPPKTIHFNTHTPDLDLHYGQNPTWVSDMPQSEAWRPIFQRVTDKFRLSIMERMLPAPTRRNSNNKIFAEIYGSTKHLGDAPLIDPLTNDRLTAGIPGAKAKELPIGTQRAIARAMTALFTDKLGDSIRWYPSHDYAGCEACGSGPPL